MKKSWIDVFKHTWSDFNADHCSQLAAALSYYTIFAIPPLLIVALLVLGRFVTTATVQSTVQGEAGKVMGPQAAAVITTIMQHAHRPPMGISLAGVIGAAALLFSAVGFFLSLQYALNRAWDVAPDPKLSAVKGFLLQRLSGFVMLIVIAAVLLASVIASAALSAFGGFIAGLISGAVPGYLLQAADFVASLVVITVLIALLFKLLPDASVHWKDVWIGAFVTALLFVVGKLLIGLYMAHSHAASGYGAAGSVILLLLWIYYSSLILLLGAELTQAYAVERGGGMRPKKHAVRMVEIRVPDEAANAPDSAAAAERAVEHGHARQGPRSQAGERRGGG